MDTQKAQEFGMNKTGIKINPVEATKTAEGAQNLTSPPPGDGMSAMSEIRLIYITEADPVGTVPAPTSVKGMFSALMEKFKKGDHGFIDKLGERIAFERTGTRLYEALITKYEGSNDKTGFPDLSVLRQFHQEELNHYRLCCEAMEEIGGDATAMTPSADVVGVASFGLLQAVTDPAVNFKQSLEIILLAELADNDSWAMLVEMANSLGLKTIAERFERAKQEEDIHLSTIRSWVKDMNLSSGKVQDSGIQDQPLA